MAFSGDHGLSAPNIRTLYYLSFKKQYYCLISGISTFKCHSLNGIGLHSFIGSSTVRRCVFDGVVVALLEEACHGRGRL